MNDIIEVIGITFLCFLIYALLFYFLFNLNFNIGNIFSNFSTIINKNFISTEKNRLLKQQIIPSPTPEELPFTCSYVQFPDTVDYTDILYYDDSLTGNGIIMSSNIGTICSEVYDENLNIN